MGIAVLPEMAAGMSSLVLNEFDQRADPVDIDRVKFMVEQPERDRLVGAVPFAGGAGRAIELCEDTRRCVQPVLVVEARIGPTVCELLG